MWILRKRYIIYKQDIKENSAGTEKRVFLHNSNIQLWRTAWLRIKMKILIVAYDLNQGTIIVPSLN